MLKRFVIAVHRWLGSAVCLLFLLWFSSGIGMMYWDFPAVTAADRLERSPALSADTIRLSPEEAAARVGLSQQPAEMRLNSFDGRPVYRFRERRAERVVYADTGEEQVIASPPLLARAAAAWTGQSAASATVDRIDDVDQWTLQIDVSSLGPLWKYSWPNGEQVYVSDVSGEVVQYTTTASRIGAYLGPIPHWLYFTPLRKHGAQWSQLVTWSSGIGALVAALGMVVGLWVYSPTKAYRVAGLPTSIPYRGQKRWHAVLGLVCGLGAVTWAFSGMLSMEPFPALTGRPADGRRGGAVGSTVGGIVQAFGRRPLMSDVAALSPRVALAQLATFAVKELDLRTFGGEPFYLATLARGDTRVVPFTGAPLAGFDRQRIIDVATKAALPGGVVEASELDQYDRYYLDRHRVRPLPVVLVRTSEPGDTRYYIDPRTASVVGAYNSRRWVTRWLYHGLHSLDVPWLYNHRPAWDLVVIAFMLGGTALSVTSVVLAWRVVVRTRIQ